MIGSAPAFDAVVLAGGRSSRLGGTPKAALTLDGHSLLDLACRAAAGAERTVVVGPPVQDGMSPVPAKVLPGSGSSGTDSHRSAPADAVRREFVRESPPFGGPAAAVAAAVAHLGPDGAPWVLVLACDMPRAALTVPVLLEAAAVDPGLSVLAREGGRDQPLAALYRLDALKTAVEAVGGSGATNLSMKALLATVHWRAVDVPPGSTADVDTWDDALSLGVADGTSSGAALDDNFRSSDDTAGTDTSTVVRPPP